VAGDPAPGHVCWPLCGLFAALFEEEGPNDGLVSVTSAEAFGTPLAGSPADHLRQMNWLTDAPNGSLNPLVRSLYDQVLDNVIAHGFGERITPAVMSGGP
jgi:triacylglycerol lipase